MVKTCTQCGLELGSQWFRLETRTNVGLQSVCKMCESLWRTDHRETPSVRQDRSAYHNEYKEKHARINSDPSALDKSKYCPMCGRTKSAGDFNTARKRRGGLSAQCKACNRARAAEYVFGLKERVYDLLGHVCSRCSFSDKRALQIDHVNGGGNQEHLEIKNYSAFLKKVIAGASAGDYQILCANCNWIKRFEKDENPVTKAVAA